MFCRSTVLFAGAMFSKGTLLKYLKGLGVKKLVAQPTYVKVTPVNLISTDSMLSSKAYALPTSPQIVSGVQTELCKWKQSNPTMVCKRCVTLHSNGMI
jgi:hypothetical protein